MPTVKKTNKNKLTAFTFFSIYVFYLFNGKEKIDLPTSISRIIDDSKIYE